jgi:hypothetical protein
LPQQAHTADCLRRWHRDLFGTTTSWCGATSPFRGGCVCVHRTPKCPGSWPECPPAKGES